jgi:hypothetical protein
VTATLQTPLACPNIDAQYVQNFFLISLESQLSRSSSIYDHSNYFVDFFEVFVGNSLFQASTVCITFNTHFAKF